VLRGDLTGLKPGAFYDPHDSINQQAWFGSLTSGSSDESQNRSAMNLEVTQLVIEAANDLVGLRCEQTANPIGSVLSIDFGEMVLAQDAIPGERPHGWRHLTIFSPWRLESADAVLVDWNVEGGAGGRIAPMIGTLVGDTVQEVQTAPPGWDLWIVWLSGLVLKVFGDVDDSREKAWMILGTDGLCITAVPICR
jgi:hypothetical protein